MNRCRVGAPPGTQLFKRMKTILALLLLAGLPWASPCGRAQTNATATNAPAASKPSVAPAPAAAPAPPPSGEKILLITLEDPPLEIIRTLAEQAQLTLELDERVQNGVDAGGKAIPKWADPVSVRWENLTARQALEDFLSRYSLVLVPGSQPKTLRVTYTAGLPTPAVAANTSPGSSATPARAAAPASVPIKIEDQPVLDAITSLGRLANLNLLFDPRVTAGIDPENKPVPFLTNTISVRWEHVTPRQALDSVLENNNLMLVENTNTHIDRITFRPPPAQEPLVTRVFQLHYANPTNIMLVLSNALPVRSKISKDVRTSSLVVQTTEKEFTTVETILTQLDTPTRQVLI